MNARLTLALVAMLAALCYMYSIDFAKGQEAHTHDGAVGRFYQTWMMPDNRAFSCCHDEDCAPAASKFESGKWYAMRDGQWIQIPEKKIETERDSPDVRSHLCGKNYSGGWKGGTFTVFCFIAGWAS